MVMHELVVFEVHVKGNKVLGFAAFSLWYLCSQSQVVTYSLLVHVWFDYFMTAQIIIQIPIVSIVWDKMSII